MHQWKTIAVPIRRLSACGITVISLTMIMTMGFAQATIQQSDWAPPQDPCLDSAHDRIVHAFPVATWPSRMVKLLLSDSKCPMNREALLRRQELDGSVASLDVIDEFLRTVQTQARRDQKPLGADEIVDRIGAYLGEVIQRTSKPADWVWMTEDEAIKFDPSIRFGHPESVGFGVVLRETHSGRVAYPFDRVLYCLGSNRSIGVKSYALDKIMDRKPDEE